MSPPLPAPRSDPVQSRHHPHQEAEQRHDHLQPLGVCVRGAGGLGHHADPQERPGDGI